jgi:hypothetical protein
VIQEPDPDGLAKWSERGNAESRNENTPWPIATANGPDGRVVGMIEASAPTGDLAQAPEMTNVRQPAHDEDQLQ